MKKILLTLVGVICSLGMWADDSTFGITRTIADTETTTDKTTSGAAVTGKAVSEDVIVGSCDDVVVAKAYSVESDMTDKARNTYWYNSSSIKCYVDKGTHNYRTTTKTLGDNNYFAFTLTIATGKTITIKSITGDIMMDGDNTSYQMAIVNNEGTEVYTSQTKACTKSASALKTVSVSELSTEIQSALTNMTGTVTVKMRWTNTANTGKYCVIKDFNVVATVADAAAQTQYTKPTITEGDYDQTTGKYSVTITKTEEDGTISYKLGDGEYQTYSDAISVDPQTLVTAKVTGDTYDDSDEKTLTTSAKPQLDTPTAALGAYNFETEKYSITLSAATGATIYYTTDDWATYPEYTEAIEVTAGATLKAKAQQNNMTTSEDLVYTVPAAPSDGSASTPTTASTYTSNVDYNLGAITIPGAVIAGQISSGSTPINNSIKTRCNAALTSGRGFYVNVNSGYTITSIKIVGCSNQTGDNKCTAVYIDGTAVSDFEAVTLPLAAKSGSTGTIELTNIAATNKIEFAFEQNYQAQMNITVTYLVPVYNEGVTSEGYGTMYYEKELVCPTGTKAYTGSLSGTTLTLTEIADGDGDTKVIPAKTPVVIKGEGGYFAVGTTGATTPTGNDLKGTATEITTPDNAYVLGYSDTEKTNFFKFTGETIPANKAYLVISSGSAKGITISIDDDIATAVNAVKAVNNSSSTKKYVKNGRLVIETANGTFNAAGARVK